MPLSVASLLRRAREGDHQAGLEAARRDEVDPGQLEELSYQPLAETRAAVAAHSQTAEPTLYRLVYDADISVPAAVARRRDLEGRVLDALHLRAKADYFVLRGRDRAMVLEIVLALASNPAVPLAAIEDLLAHITTSHLPRLLAREAEREDVLALLAAHQKATVRQELAKNPLVPRPLLHDLAADRNEKVARAAARALERDRAAVAEEALAARRRRLEHGARRAPTHDADAALLRGGPAALAGEVDWFAARAAEAEGPWLELVCATGRLTAALAARRPERLAVGLDLAPALLHQARARLPEAGRAAFVCADLEAGLPLADGRLGGLSCREAFHLVPAPQALLAECLRVLGRGGRFVAQLLCLQGEEADQTAYAAAAAARGFFFPPADAAGMMVATSGLVIDELSPAPEPRPAYTDRAALAALGDPLWAEILAEAEANGADPSRLQVGMLRAAGRKLSL
jgi:SAM-dependent methyltransferase